jgi:hypothetical protein
MPPDPKPVPDEQEWTESERERRAAVLAGRTVVANQRKGRDENLRRWAEARGLLVYIDRPSGSVWNNPYRLRKDGDRDQCCDKFEVYLQTRPDLLSRLPELRGKVLVCWCHPKRCHGHYLARLANALQD